MADEAGGVMRVRKFSGLVLTTQIKRLTMAGRRTRTGEDLEELAIHHPELVQRLIVVINEYLNEMDGVNGDSDGKTRPGI